MKYFIILLLVCFTAGAMYAQVGIKAGLNFANVTNASSINNANRTGFHAGIFLAPPSRGVLGYRSELIYSKQGYDYKTNSNTGNVNLDYLMFPNFMTINITKFFQIQLGGQMSILLNAKADSTTTGGSSGQYSKTIDFMNRFDYGYGGGIEVHPVSGLLIGGRINISLSNLYKNVATDVSNPGDTPSFVPNVDVKNNVFQVFAGWRFGKTTAPKAPTNKPSM